jgi:glycosyltransferase involved in cell wall biosynthesis
MSNPPLISVLMAYHNRRPQLIMTLESLVRSTVKSFEVIVVDDGSTTEHCIDDLPLIFPFLKVIKINAQQKWWTDSCIPYNHALSNSSGSIILVQNPECYHATDILQFLSSSYDKTSPVSFGCYSLSESESKILPNVDRISIKSCAVVGNGESGWYNHSVYRPSYYHFCTAIPRECLLHNVIFDTRFADGCCYGDDELVRRLRNQFTASFSIIDSQYVMHQHHYSNTAASYDYTSSDFKRRTKRNKRVFSTLVRRGTYKPWCHEIMALHKIYTLIIMLYDWSYETLRAGYLALKGTKC